MSTVTKKWREELSPEVNRKLDKLLWQVVKHEQGYSKAADKGKAQLWVALAEVYDQLDKLNSKIDSLSSNNGKETESKQENENGQNESNQGLKDTRPELDEKLRDSLISY